MLVVGNAAPPPYFGQPAPPPQAQQQVMYDNFNQIHHKHQ